MSNNISADLARFNGEVGPQYLDVEDKTGGPDGTMKPLTKEILREMIVTNFPELMNVSDETAQQKLDALDNKLQELDQKLMTLDEIKTQLEGTINTRLSGSIVENDAIKTKTVRKVVVDTLIDGETIAGDHTWSKSVPIGYTDETDIWFAVNIDQQPWTLNTDIFTYDRLTDLSTPAGHGVYPPKDGEEQAYTNTAYPSTSLWLGGVYLHPAFGLSMPSTVEGAFGSKTGYFEDAKVGIRNESDIPATVTLKAVRVWR